MGGLPPAHEKLSFLLEGLSELLFGGESNNS